MKYRGFSVLLGRFGVADPVGQVLSGETEARATRGSPDVITARGVKKSFLGSKGIVIAVALAGATLWFSPGANALSSFARQTGLSCATCHWSFPELTPTGRDFKLHAYTTTAEQNLTEAGSTRTSELSLPQWVPLSASLFTSLTYTRLSQPNSQDPSIEVPQALDLWLAGQVLPHFGEAVQITYAASSDHFSFDVSDVRYANETTLFGEDLVYGVDSNNSPTFEDVWNSTPAYGFPYMAVPDSAGFTPMATTLIDGALARRVIGGGLYAMFADHLFALAEIYRSQYLGELQPETGAGPSSTFQAINIQYVAPYWRLAWQQDVGKNNYFEIGTYGTYVSSTPNAVSGPTDRYLDLAADLTYELTLGNGDFITVHSTFIYETSNLEGSVAVSAAAKANHNLETWRLDANYHFGNKITLTAGPFMTWGTSDSLLYPVSTTSPVTSFANGSPNNLGYIAQASYWPGQNFQIGLQYRGFITYNGASSNYENGRNASDNDTIYAFIWINY